MRCIIIKGREDFFKGNKFKALNGMVRDGDDVFKGTLWWELLRYFKGILRGILSQKILHSKAFLITFGMKSFCSARDLMESENCG